MTPVVYCGLLVVEDLDPSVNQQREDKMTLSKAIEIKLRKGYKLSRTDPRDMGEADRLSVEAMKRLKEHREEHIDFTYRALPGETED